MITDGEVTRILFGKIAEIVIGVALHWGMSTQYVDFILTDLVAVGVVESEKENTEEKERKTLHELVISDERVCFVLMLGGHRIPWPSMIHFASTHPGCAWHSSSSPVRFSRLQCK